MADGGNRLNCPGSRRLRCCCIADVKTTNSETADSKIMAMKIADFFLTLLVLTVLAGCERGPTTEHATSGSSVKILSISPENSSPLRVGEHVKMQVEVAYTLSADRGTLSLAVQTADNTGVTQNTQVVTKGAGQTKLETEFVVPNTKSILVFTPLAAQSEANTSIVDMWAFSVIAK